MTKLQRKRRRARLVRIIRRVSVLSAGDHRQGPSRRRCAACGAQYVRLYRSYGCFLREDDVVCNAHVSNGGAWWVPLVEAPDGTVWGYTSCPRSDVARWEKLLDAKPDGLRWARGEWSGPRSDGEGVWRESGLA